MPAFRTAAGRATCAEFLRTFTAPAGDISRAPDSQPGLRCEVKIVGQNAQAGAGSGHCARIARSLRDRNGRFLRQSILRLRPSLPPARTWVSGLLTRKTLPRGANANPHRFVHRTEQVIIDFEIPGIDPLDLALCDPAQGNLCRASMGVEVRKLD